MEAKAVVSPDIATQLVLKTSLGINPKDPLAKTQSRWNSSMGHTSLPCTKLGKCQGANKPRLRSNDRVSCMANSLCISAEKLVRPIKGCDG